MLLNDFRQALRTLRKSPMFSLTAIATIALGIGASTAIFSVANAVLLRPLPYKDAGRLVTIGGDMRTRATYDQPESNENFQDLANGSKAVFDDVAGVFTNRGVIPRQDGTPEQVRFGNVTTNFFRLMGARLAEGRDFNESDGVGQPPPDPAAVNAPPPPQQLMAILSYEYWQRRYARDPGVIGKPLAGAGPNRPLIVGVLAPGFELLFSPSANIEQKPDIWIAARLFYDNRNRNAYFIRGVGRLKNGVSVERAQEASEAVSADIRKGFPIYGTGNFHFHIEPMQQHLVEQVRPAILALMGAVVFLLMIACANVANLLLVRMSLRERELAVRAALGGTRWRLIRQMLAESVVLAGAGTMLGIALAYAGIRELIAISPANLPRLETIAIDPQVLGFSILAGLAAAAMFGLAPALRASRPDVMDMLRGGGRNAGLAGGRMRSVVAIVEVALSFVLLVGSGLMVRSFVELQHIDAGYDSRNLLTFQVLGGRPVTKPEEQQARVRAIGEKLRVIGGAEGVTASAFLPLAGGFSTIRWGKEDALTDPSKFRSVDWQLVLPGYFQTMRTPLVAGREFTDADNTPQRALAVIDTVMAAKAFPNESPIGKRILIRIRGPQPEWVEIVGVVAHQRQSSLVELGREQIYFTDGFLGFGRVGRWAIRTSGDPARLEGAVRSAIGSVDSLTLVNEMKPMSEWMDAAQGGTRFALLLIGVFAGIAALLASVGLYGVLSTFVRQRTAEIGVRMALGAAPSNIFALVVGHGLRLSATGIAIGMIAALALTRAMTSMLIGVKPTDPMTFAAIVALFLAIAALACWLPARRAAGLAPTVALRE